MGLNWLKKALYGGSVRDKKFRFGGTLGIPGPLSMKISFKRGRIRLRWVSQLMRSEWDLQTLRSCFLPHDVEEVRKIRLSDKTEDVIAWYYEKTGIFTVRSVYKLAMYIDQEAQRQEGSLYNGIWAAQVPPKVRVFAWQLAQEGLAIQSNRKQRTLAEKATCQVCGVDDETGHHAVVRCTKAVSLRHALRDKWLLSDEEHFRYSGPTGCCCYWSQWMRKQGQES
jgi:hypothetical protein